MKSANFFKIANVDGENIAQEGIKNKNHKNLQNQYDERRERQPTVARTPEKGLNDEMLKLMQDMNRRMTEMESKLSPVNNTPKQKQNLPLNYVSRNPEQFGGNYNPYTRNY